jgi:hypothetical protein
LSFVDVVNVKAKLVVKSSVVKCRGELIYVATHRGQLGGHAGFEFSHFRHKLGETVSPPGPGLELASLCLLSTGALPSAIGDMHTIYEHNYVGSG